MTMTHKHPKRREGISLLEVLCALSIFLLSWVVIGNLISLTSDAALESHLQAEAGHLCQAKLAEVIAGAVPLVSQSGNSFDEAPEWQWTLDCEPADVPNLWRVQVQVTRADNSPGAECSMSQFVLDPAVRGSTNPTSQSTTSGSASGNSSGSSGM